MILSGLASGLAGGAMNLIGSNSQDQGYTGPEFWEKLLNIGGGLWASAEQRRALQEYMARADQQLAEALAVARAGGPEALAAYDASSGLGADELERLRTRQTEAGGQLLADTGASRAQFLSQLGKRNAGLMGEYDKAQTGWGASMASMLGGLEGQETDILAGYEDRYKRAEADLAGYGAQQKADIDRMFQEEQARLTQDMVNRGLASSTVAANQALGTTERQSAEQRRLAEDLIRNRINVLSGLSGEKLAAQERLGGRQAGYQFAGMQTGYQGAQNALAQRAAQQASEAAYDAAMRGDELAVQRYLMDADTAMTGNLANWRGTEAANRANLTQSGYRDMLNTIMGWQNVPPPQTNLPQIFGQNTASTPQVASPWPSFWGAMAPGVGQAAGYGMYNWMNPRTRTEDNQSDILVPGIRTYDEAWEPTASQYYYDQTVY